MRGTLLGGPHNKDYSILGSILGSLYFGKLPCNVCCELGICFMFGIGCSWGAYPEGQWKRPGPSERAQQSPKHFLDLEVKCRQDNGPKPYQQ